MEEILELKQCLLDGNLDKALEVTNYLEEMGKDDKIATITSFCVVLLTHLIENKVEKRMTRPWQTSIRNSAKEIHRRNKRRKSKGFYLSEEELEECLEDAYPDADAIRKASLEFLEGIYDARKVAEFAEPYREEIFDDAKFLIIAAAEDQLGFNPS